ncbi:hypothetical protein M0R04_05360 [Candidatus Dojkabacteria bacterium]|jgi:hypothetical protein|nr:hypothetical protein [Candidatus Dojkabacteria bacterium]
MSSIEFVKQVAAGQAAEAKETINNMISSQAFEALDAKKVDVAKNMFSDPVVEEGFESDDSGKEPTKEQKKDSDVIKKKSESNTKALRSISNAFGNKK